MWLCYNTLVMEKGYTKNYKWMLLALLSVTYFLTQGSRQIFNAGVICCLGSVTGFEGDGVGTMYGTAKSGLFNFVKGLAIAGGPHNVRALCVTPGPVLTRAAMSGMPTALGRAAETHELVDEILFMCSDNASFITSTNHVVDGGRLCMYQPYVAPKQRRKNESVRN